MYLCDVHSHTKISPDSKAELSDMARAAMAAGLRELCVTDHCDLLNGWGAPVTTFDWPAAKKQYLAVKEDLGDRLVLRLGIDQSLQVCPPAGDQNSNAPPQHKFTLSPLTTISPIT